MDANDYQVQAMRTASTITQQQKVVAAALGIIGEGGEVAANVATLALDANDVEKILELAVILGEAADMVKKHLYHGHALSRADLDRHYQRIRLVAGDRITGIPPECDVGFFRHDPAKELGDVQWYVALGATAHGVSLDEVMQANIDKLLKRYPQGFSVEASQNRSADDV